MSGYRSILSVEGKQVGNVGPKSFYHNRADGGLEASDLKRMRELEDENNRLKKMYADLVAFEGFSQ